MFFPLLNFHHLPYLYLNLHHPFPILLLDYRLPSIPHFSDLTTTILIPAAYRITIDRNQIGLLSGRLVYYEHISFAHKHICRIFVSLSLRRKVFVLSHVSPVARHMGEYETLYRIRLRFLWPLMRADIKEWIQ